MGCCKAPSVFSQRKYEVFKQHLSPWVLVYLVDVLLFEKKEKEHKSHLRQAFELLLKDKLYAKTRSFPRPPSRGDG